MSAHANGGRRRKPAVRLITTELADRVSEPGPTVLGPADAGAYIARLIGSKDREHFVVLHLNAAHRIVAAETVSIGTLNLASAHPREVFKAAILSNSKAIICGHNHPSGALDPSKEDRDTQARLLDAGKLLGIDVLDFLIVAGDRHISLTA